MGPRLISRGNAMNPRAAPAIAICFNGAATDQSRKLVCGHKTTAASGRFNGAATDQSRKLTLYWTQVAGGSGFNGAATDQSRK